jgi:CheY-like chemotaxis protein
MSKFLINGSNKAIRTGEYVEATSDGEWILDSETAADDRELTTDVLKELAETNGLSVKSSWNRGELLTKLVEHLTRLDLASQDKMPISQIIRETVADCAESRDVDEDSDAFEIDVLTKVINRLREEEIAFKIKPIGGLVKKEIIEQGLVLTATARKEAVFDILSAESFAPESWEDVEAMVETITEQVSDTNQQQAISLCRKFCKNAEIDFPKRSKAKRVPFRQKMITFLIENRDAEDSAIEEFLAENEREKSLGSAKKLREVINQAYDAGVKSVA